MRTTLFDIIDSEIQWIKDKNKEDSFIAKINNLNLMLQINDFPEHPFIYSFFSEVGFFESLDLPKHWRLPTV